MGYKQVDAAHEADQLKTSLRRCGVKLTHQRMVIYQEVTKSKNHPDAESICKSVRRKLPMVSLDTVYRTLWLFQDLGLITVLAARDRVRFDGNTRPHHHFVCKKCGQMRDFYSEEYDRLQIPRSVKNMGDVESAQVEVRGICVQCSAKPGSRKNASQNKEGR
jgi:Fur family peroxide stress response transcriptional regulator